MSIRNSLSFKKLEALYGWGYYTAKKLVPMTDYNLKAIQNMYSDIDAFTKYNEAEDLVHMFKFFTAYITPGKKFKYRFTVSDGPHEFDALDSSVWFPEEKY